jgi:hypothetical protein
MRVMAFHPSAFLSSYGPWAVITGGSDGLGAEFASQIAAAGLDLVLIARRKDILEGLAGDLHVRYGIKTLPVSPAMAEPGQCRT